MKTALISIFAMIVFSSISQSNPKKSFDHDISLIGGMSFSNINFIKYGLMYRYMINDQWKLKLSAYHGKFTTSWSEDIPFFSSDSLIILRDRININNRFIVKTGFDKTIFTHFVLGADLVFGYNKENRFALDKGLAYDSNSQNWQTCVECVYDFYAQPYKSGINFQTASLQERPYVNRYTPTKYLIYGISANIGVNCPLGQRFELGAQYSPEIVWHYNINNNFRSFMKFNHSVDLLLRFKV